MKINIVDQLQWSFHSNHPTVYVGETYYQADPTPCYGHDINIVEEYVKRVEKIFPLDPAYSPDWHILKYETIERVNGWTGRRYDWQWEKPEGEDYYSRRPWKAHITLLGKRTPIHPVMTKYLVLHEYGHVVHYWLGTQQGINTEGDDSEDKIYIEYAKERGIDLNPNYGPGNWASNIGEIFANDFRILLGKSDDGFWPHDVPHPKDVPNLLEWWKSQRRKYGY